MVRMWSAILALLVGIGNTAAADLSSPLHNNNQWHQAQKYLAQGRAAEAKAEFEELLKRYPDEPDLHLFRGMSLLRLRDPQGAVVATRKAIELNPNHVDARTFLAWIELEVRGDTDAAIKEYQRTIELQPELPAAYSNLAVAQKRKGNLDQAIASLNRALQLKPDFSAALTTRGSILAEQNRWAEARHDFEQALKLDPRDDGALYGLSQTLRETRDYAAAQKNLGELISRSPNFIYWLQWSRIGLIRFWWILLSVAMVLAIMGRLKKARTQTNG